jgi:hypothetical protein
MNSNSAIVDDLGLRLDASAAVRPGERIKVCPYCMERVLPSMSHCPRCLNEMVTTPPPPAPSATDDQRSAAAQAKTQGVGAAMYTLESAVNCPHCEREIRTFKVLRVLRTQASFTSTLPRKGYVIICPECERMMSAELSGLI